MRILDVNDVEIPESEVDLDKGYLEPDSIVKEHHEAVEEQPEENHFAVGRFIFDDGTDYIPTSEDDPHIDAVDAENGVFKYKNLPGEDEKQVFGIDVKQVIDKEAVPAKEAWDETEDVQRYKLYTKEELEQREAAKKAEEEAEAKRQQQEAFMAEAPERLDNVEMAQDELILVVADILGGTE